MTAALLIVGLVIGVALELGLLDTLPAAVFCGVLMLATESVPGGLVCGVHLFRALQSLP